MRRCACHVCEALAIPVILKATIAYTVQFRLQPFKRCIGPLIDAVVVLIHVKAEADTEPKPQTLKPNHLRNGAPKYTSLNSAAGAGLLWHMWHTIASWLLPFRHFGFIAPCVLLALPRRACCARQRRVKLKGLGRWSEIVAP